MWNSMKLAFLGIFVLGMGVAPALAAKPGKKDPAQTFKKLDANNDGSLTVQEMKGKGKKDAAKVEKRFKKLDKDSDGKVTLAEIKAGGKKKPRKKA